MASKPLFSFGRQKEDLELAQGADKTWVIVYFDTRGKRRTKLIVAPTRSRARVQFGNWDTEIYEIREHKQWWETEFGGGVKPVVILQVTRQMASFTQAGIPILDALQLLADSTKNKPMAKTLAAMVDDIREGDTLAQAAGYHKTVFPEFYIAVLQAAERSGDLAGTFETLTRYLERDLAASRAVKSAMYYPAVLFTLGGAAIIILSVFVLPKFQDFFASLGSNLPTATVIMLAATGFVTAYWPVIIATVLAVILAYRGYRRTKQGRYVTDLLVLKLPLIGGVVELIALERFCRILSSLTAAGVPLTESLGITADVVGNHAFARAVRSTREGVISGRGLTEPMAQSKMFPQETIQIFRVGEHSGLLGRQLGNAAEYYAGEVDYKLKNLTALLEPAILVIVGGGTGFVAVALVSAMYGIFSATSVGS